MGTLSAILLGLLVSAGAVVTSRRSRVAAPVTDGADVDDRQPSALAPAIRRRELLPAVSAGCTPRPGCACWRGQLTLSSNVVRAWRARRDEKRTASDAATELADVPLPPDGAFHTFFDLRVYRMGDADEAKGTDVTAEESSSIMLADDGSFEVHVPPGRYGLEATSRDDLIAGGRDDLPAAAGDFEDGVDIVLEPTVTLAGRVVDEDGLLLSAMVTISRIGDSESVTVTQSDGTFRFDELRPGPFRVTAETDDGQTTKVTFVAPLENVTVHLARPRDGLLLVPRALDGSCPRGVLSLTPPPPGAPDLPPSGLFASESFRPGDAKRKVPIIECQAIFADIAPGSAWDVVGSVGQAAIKTRVQFGFESPLAPLCLTSGCDPNIAVLDLLAVDLEGRVLDATVTVKASPPGGPRVGMVVYQWQRSLPANQSITVEISVGTMSVTRQIWLRPGVNSEVVRLPVRAADVADGDEVMLE